MATPERPKLTPYIDACDYFMDRIAEIEDEMDTIGFIEQSIHVTFDQRPDTPPDWSAITDPEFHQQRIEDWVELEKLTEALAKYNQAFDALTHGHDIPFVVSFLRSQARKLGRQKTDPDYFKRSQHLRCLAADLNRAA